MRRILPALLLCLGGAAWGQASIEAFPSGAVLLSDGWRYQPGDNPAWASPQLDDSGWQQLNPQPQSDMCPTSCWYRLRVQLPAHPGALTILLIAQGGVTEAYIDGARAGTEHFEPTWTVREQVEDLLEVPAEKESVVLAVRIHPPRVAFDANEAVNLSAWIGSPDAVKRVAELHRSKRLLRFVGSGAINLVILLAGIGSLLLFFSQRAFREYLWLGIYLVVVGTGGGLSTAAIYAFAPGILNDLYSDPAIYLTIVAQIEFTYAFIRKRPNRMWRVYEAALLVCPLVALLCALGIVHNGAYFLLESAVTLPAALLLPVVLLYWHRRGNAEARWLILPSVGPAIAVMLMNASEIGSVFSWNLEALERPILLWHEVPLFYNDLADGIFLLAIGVVMYFRFTRLSREQARAAGELEAAREIQRQPVPATLPELAGCRLESAYIPASEVGGDFYQVLPQPNGAWLFVVGDVSGKGLKAAMTGALAIGAIRTLAAEDLQPGALMTRLNRQVVAARSGGFITCLCAVLALDGTLTLANAGHLAPYRNGEEVELEFGLPLGLTDVPEYEQTTLELQIGDRITLMTDGVVEAQSESGELFGFDRTKAISRQSAEQIANAAQAFGQEDDITVLAITFARGEANSISR
jgi:hypothetical protein